VGCGLHRRERPRHPPGEEQREEQRHSQAHAGGQEHAFGDVRPRRRELARRAGQHEMPPHLIAHAHRRHRTVQAPVARRRLELHALHAVLGEIGRRDRDRGRHLVGRLLGERGEGQAAVVDAGARSADHIEVRLRVELQGLSPAGALLRLVAQRVGEGDGLPVEFGTRDHLRL